MKSFSSALKNGFTLIEVLVVLVIIAFATNLVVYTMGDSYEEELEQRAQALQVSINFASEYAILNQRELGLHVADNGYEFLVYDEDKWRALEDVDGVLKAHQFEEPLSIRLQQQDLPWAQDNLLSTVDWEDLLGSDDDDFLEREKMKIPQVMILSSGEVSPFELYFEALDSDFEPFVIRGEFMAPVELTQGEQQ